MNNATVLRLMRPMKMSQSCLKCHTRQGYQEGDILGGVSVAVPFAPYLALSHECTRKIVFSHGVIGVLGMVAVLIILLLGKKRMNERAVMLRALQESEEQRCSIMETSPDYITERKRDEKEKEKLGSRLLQAQKLEAISTLAGGITHDFNNILTAILGYADMAREEVSPGSSLALHLDEVLKAGNRAKELVQQILTFSRQNEHKYRPMQPHLIVKEVMKLLRSSILSFIEIQQQIDPKSGTVLADEIHLHQIIMNLCTNAYQAMRKTGGILVVTLKAVQMAQDDQKVNGFELIPGPYVMLEVSDTGSGMDPTTRKKIFNPYFTTKKIDEGTGLGLSVVHGIVKSYRRAYHRL